MSQTYFLTFVYSRRDNLQGRHPSEKTTFRVDNLPGRQPIWKTTSKEDDPKSHQQNILSINSSFQKSTSGILFNLVSAGKPT
jgi:hypothetical protein